MSSQRLSNLKKRVWLALGTRMPAFALMLLWPAGTWRWWECWVVIGIWVSFAVAVSLYLLRHDPALLAERLNAGPVQKGQVGWDKILMVLLFIPGFGLYIVPGLDVVRFGWSEPLPLWVRLTAMAAHLPGLWLIGRVMRENTFLSTVVKIDQARGHEVITTGPYAIVRHPMYAAVLALIFAVPLALGSRYGLVPATLAALLLIVRTLLEDRTLHRELPGYPEYALQTPYRLLPGIW